MNVKSAHRHVTLGGLSSSRSKNKNHLFILRATVTSTSTIGWSSCVTHPATPYPPDELDWFMNGLKVVTDLDEGIRITNSVSLRSRTIWSELVIEHAQMHHGGTYICRTSDELVTNIKVNVLSDGRMNVKRGTFSGKFLSSPDGRRSTSSRAAGSLVLVTWVAFVLHATKV